jgi:membrane-associated HD superfamily phosphohydrolase
LIYLVLVYAAILIFRKIDWRNFVIPIVGVFTPIFLSYTYLLAFDDLERFNNLWFWNYELNLGIYTSTGFIFPLVVIGIVALVAIFPTTKRSLLAKIDFKATWTLLIAHIVISLFVVMIAPEKNGSELIFLFFPLSVLFANYLQVISRYWIKESLIYVFILMIINNLF